MKIRTGFVANSSSSSFLIYGITEYERDKAEEWHEKLVQVDEKAARYLLSEPNEYEFYPGIEIYTRDIEDVKKQLDRAKEICDSAGMTQAGLFTVGWYDG